MNERLLDERDRRALYAGMRADRARLTDGERGDISGEYGVRSDTAAADVLAAD